MPHIPLTAAQPQSLLTGWATTWVYTMEPKELPLPLTGSKSLAKHIGTLGQEKTRSGKQSTEMLQTEPNRTKRNQAGPAGTAVHTQQALPWVQHRKSSLLPGNTVWTGLSVPHQSVMNAFNY